MPFPHDEIGVSKLKVGRCVKRYDCVNRPQHRIGESLADLAPPPKDFFFRGGDSALVRAVEKDVRKAPGLAGMVERVALAPGGMVIEDSKERRHKKEPVYESEAMRYRPEGIKKVGRLPPERQFAAEAGKRAFEAITHRPTAFENPNSRDVYDADGAKRSFPEVSLKPTSIVPRWEDSSPEFEGGVRKFEESLSYDTRPLTTFDGNYLDPFPRKMVHHNAPVGAVDSLGRAAGKSAWGGRLEED